MASNGTDDKVLNEIGDDEFNEMKDRCKIIFEADPDQVHTDSSLRRFIKAFGSVDDAFKALLKCNKWRREYGVEKLTPQDPDIERELMARKMIVLRHRDRHGRPIIYVAAKNHNVNNRDIDTLTKFIVFMLENACKKCDESIIDNLCLVFDLKDFSKSNMDYQFVKNLIWLLSKYYPERLGVCLIINAPTLFSGCWAVIRRWLNEVTASKVTFINNDIDLCQYLHPDMLPSD